MGAMPALSPLMAAASGSGGGLNGASLPSRHGASCTGQERGTLDRRAVRQSYSGIVPPRTKAHRMSRTARLALLLVGSIIVFTALLGARDRRFEPVETAPGTRIEVRPQST